MVLRRNRHRASRAHPTGRPFYGCTQYPKCRNTHGAREDGTPLGRPGTRDERAARMQAHEWFDRLWQSRVRTREEAYAWLRSALPHLPPHIASMDVSQCTELVAAVRSELVRDLSTHFKGRSA